MLRLATATTRRTGKMGPIMLLLDQNVDSFQHTSSFFNETVVEIARLDLWH